MIRMWRSPRPKCRRQAEAVPCVIAFASGWRGAREGAAELRMSGQLRVRGRIVWLEGHWDLSPPLVCVPASPSGGAGRSRVPSAEPLNNSNSSSK